MSLFLAAVVLPMLVGTMGMAAPAQALHGPEPVVEQGAGLGSGEQPSVTELPPLPAPMIGAWSLAREIHEFHEGGYSLVNRLYATDGQQRVLLYESPRPVRFLAAAGAYWILWDTKLARTGALVFVVYVPEDGKGSPFTIFQSQYMESPVCVNDELVSSRYAEGALHLELLSTDVDTGKRYVREATLSHRADGQH